MCFFPHLCYTDIAASVENGEHTFLYLFQLIGLLMAFVLKYSKTCHERLCKVLEEVLLYGEFSTSYVADINILLCPKTSSRLYTAVLIKYMPINIYLDVEYIPCHSYSNPSRLIKQILASGDCDRLYQITNINC